MSIYLSHRASVKSWLRRKSLAERFRDRAEANDRLARFPTENFADLREAGFLALTVPEAYGGMGIRDRGICPGSGADRMGRRFDGAGSWHAP